MDSPHKVARYYETLQATPIGNLAHELLKGRVTQASATEMECDCPRHQSISKRSLKINLLTNRWHCWGCNVGGAPLQLVEFIKFGACTTRQRGRMPKSHREARDLLAKRCSLPPISQLGKSPKEIEQAEKAYLKKESCLEALATLAEEFHQCLLRQEQHLEWVQANYGLTLETIKELKIGLADYSGEPTIQSLAELHGIDRTSALGTGLFGLSENNSAWPALKDRIVFPYWKGGRIVAMVGRLLPGSSTSKQPKYKKLFVHDPQKRPYVNACMDNSAFYNEDCLLEKPDAVLITEGVTDCIAARQQGMASISPVTVQFRERDIPRLVSLLRGIKKVYLCLDNELSQVGNKSAMKLAKVLESHRIFVRIATLPLGPSQLAARETLKQEFGVEGDSVGNNLAAKMTNPTSERLEAAQRLVAAAKIDLNAYLAGGRSLNDFQEVLAGAKPRIELLIAQLDKTLDDQERYEQRIPLMKELARQPDYSLARCLKLIQAHYGQRSITIGALRGELRQANKDVKQEKKEEVKQQSYQQELLETGPNSCRTAMAEYEMQALDGGSVSLEGLGQVVANWFKKNGAKFFYEPGDEPIMFFRGKLYHLASMNRGLRRELSSFFQEHTGLTNVTSKGKVVLETLRNTAQRDGKESEPKTWLETVAAKHTIYFNLKNARNEVARITPDGVEILKNGENPDDVILLGHKRMQPIEFLPDADLSEAEKLIEDHVIKYLACEDFNRCFIVNWLSCFLLIGFSGTRPMTRFEGRYNSGKTGASKVITTLIYGRPQQKKSTPAANYADAARNPLTSLDNLEVKNMTQELNDFMLLATSGVSREKVARGTNSEVVTDVAHCLINSTGIEPLSASLGEILTRVFTIKFHSRMRCSGFLEHEMIRGIQKHRNLILSAIMKRTARVLGLIQAGHHTTVMHLLEKQLGDHHKNRCNDFLSLMYLMMVAGGDLDNVEASLTKLPQSFVDMIEHFNQASEQTGAEANPIGEALGNLFRAYQAALRADEMKNTRISEANFQEKYLVSFASPHRITDITARDLMTCLKRISREFGEPLPHKNACQFGVRFRSEMDSLALAGFKVTSRVGAGNKRYYTIDQTIPEPDERQQPQ